jgi:hypothetical protein
MSTRRKGFDSVRCGIATLSLGGQKAPAQGCTFRASASAPAQTTSGRRFRPRVVSGCATSSPFGLLRLIRSAVEHLPGPHQVATNSRKPTLRTNSVASLVRQIPRSSDFRRVRPDLKSVSTSKQVDYSLPSRPDQAPEDCHLAAAPRGSIPLFRFRCGPAPDRNVQGQPPRIRRSRTRRLANGKGVRTH